MYILLIRTDKPEAELYVYDGNEEQAAITWYAHRQLAETIHVQVRKLLDDNSLDISELGGIVVYKGPGSFTGLRIGISVANALGQALSMPVIGVAGDTWQADGVRRLLAGETDGIVVPEYGAAVHITAQKK
jgi:tRNA threonylcarbamoyladenosine biosynthesis protein TsaB